MRVLAHLIGGYWWLHHHQVSEPSVPGPAHLDVTKDLLQQSPEVDPKHTMYTYYPSFSNEFGLVQLYRMFEKYYFKHTKPPQTFSNHIVAEIARYVEFLHMRSG